MSDVFERLARKLDELPQGFPPTDSGIELKILKKIYSAEDAELALQVSPVPETAAVLSERLGKPLEETRARLDEMVMKGQIGSHTVSGEQIYMLAPFVPGVYEFQVYRLDTELSEMFEEYLPTLLKTVAGFEPGLARTVPINTWIEPETQVYPYEDVRRLIEGAKSFKVIDCICRKERGLVGHRCDHTLENCLGFSSEENAFDYYSQGGRVISKEETLKILDETEEEGLVHNALYNTKTGTGAICNCCPCCCGLMRAAKDFQAPAAIARSNFVAAIDRDDCTDCGICAEERCPMDAIAEGDEGYTVMPDLCIGCGVCTVACPVECIAMVRRPEAEQNQPPENIVDWHMQRARERAAG
jgi:electron transport complex protein RnfB